MISEVVAFPCLIQDADFDKNTVTLVMQTSDYKVSAGKHWLCTSPPQRQAIAEAEKQERNFCSRCGKQLGKNEWDIHTCTPPAKAEKQEPVAWAQFSEKGNLIDLLEEPCGGYVPLYTSPPQRKWVGLTDEEAIFLIENEALGRGDLLEVIEAKLKEKNHDRI